MFKKFKEFAFKGNVLDMAIGVVIGSAFSKIISSLVSDIITPFFGFITANVKFDDLKIVLAEKTEVAEEVAIKYGMFMENVIDFFIIAFSIFMFVSLISKARERFEKKEEVIEEVESKPTVEDILTDIKTILEEKK